MRSSFVARDWDLKRAVCGIRIVTITVGILSSLISSSVGSLYSI
nr:MAG TPA: hypothetical protein [Caudoviricetes sp.]DAT11955.1 MAG TPA: hypothetical protein [Bacteriophage sp.]